MEVNLQSSDVADEEQLFFLPDDEEESEQEIFARKALNKQRAINEHETDISTKVTEVIKIPLNSTVYPSGQSKKARELETNKMQTQSSKRSNYAYYMKNMTNTS